MNKVNLDQILCDMSGLIQTATVEALAPFIEQQNNIEKKTHEQFEALKSQLLPLLDILRSQQKPPDN